MYDEEKRFMGLPYLERYKHNKDTSNIDVTAAKGDLFKEMQIERDYIQPSDGDFAVEPFDAYE